MDESWLKELNKRNLAEEENSSKLDFAIVSVSSSVLNKLSQEEQAKFEMTEFKRATNEIEHWARVEEICDFFGVEDPDLAGNVYVRKFKSLTEEEENKWQNLSDINENIPEGFGVRVERRQLNKKQMEKKGFECSQFSCENKKFISMIKEQTISAIHNKKYLTIKS